MRRLLSLSLAFAFACFAASTRASGPDDEQLLGLLKAGGQVVLIRHTITTPGIGDPPGMRIDDCSTQRNLTDAGRRHAKVIGENLRARGVAFEQVHSSPMCRCLETARLAFGRVDEVQPITNSRGSDTEMPRQVREMRSLASEVRRSKGNVVLVSHGTTIANVTGINVDPGEMLVVTPRGDGQFELRGRLKFAAP